MIKICIPTNFNQKDLCESFKELKHKKRILDKNVTYEDILLNVDEEYKRECLIVDKDSNYTEYMTKMYKKLSNSSYKKSYPYYKKIRKNASYCPFCNIPTREVTQVDHYLPKSQFPSLSLVIKNLVPICSDCNKKKSDFFPKDNGIRFIHPYYDTIKDKIFELLNCKINKGNEIGFYFFIDKKNDEDQSISENLDLQFQLLKLNKPYSADFLQVFNEIIWEIKPLYENKDINESIEKKSARILEVKKLLQKKMNYSLEMKIRPWVYVGCKCLIESDWFFDEYLENINICKKLYS
ncbi:MAG: HNH endonuclease [Clostridium chrysemydis]|uniref:HNH endonuclease n=1 Tax=Clostridium chrysemydis TaxID=2665504 RepID=UPI003F4053FC